MNTQDMISIKAKHQNEIRRFALPLKSTYATLETSLNSLFTLSGPVIKYTDDEGDLCTISTQQEFDYAVSTTKGLLRLHLFSPEDLKASTTSAPVASTTTPQIPLSSSQECPQKHFLLEKMDNKHAQLISKRDDLKSKLASDSLNSERRRVLSWKLEKIEEKILMFEQRRKSMAHHLQNPGEHHGPWRGGRGGWGGGRGGRGGHHGPHHGPGHFEGHHGPHGQEWPHHGPPPHHHAEHDWPHHGPPHPHHFEHHGPPAHHDWPHHGPPHHFDHHGPPHHEGGHQQKEQRWLDWMDKRQANLTSKRDSLNAKIGEEGITPQRKAILTEKLTKVQEKLSALELRRQQLADGVHPCVKGAGRRGGRGGWGKHAGQGEQQTTADSTTPKK